MSLRGRRIRAVVAVFLTVLSMSLVLPAAGQELQASLPIEEAIKARYFAPEVPLSLSPDGAWVAYSVIDPTAVQVPIGFREFFSASGVPSWFIGSEVWVSSVISLQSVRAMGPGPSSWGASWSPDGRLLAFYSDNGGQAGLWIWDRDSREARRVSDVIVRSFAGYDVPQWTPDGKRVLVRALPEGVTIEQANDAASLFHEPDEAPREDGQNIVVYRSHLPSNAPAPPDLPPVPRTLVKRHFCDLALIDVRRGAVSRILRRTTVMGYALSPDGTRVAFAQYLRRQGATQQDLYHLAVASADGAGSHAILDEVEMYGRTFSWSSDSEYLSYVTSGPLAKGDVYVVAARGGSPKLLTEGSHPRFGIDGQAPRWNPSGSSVLSLTAKGVWDIPVGGGPSRLLGSGLNREVVGLVAPGTFGRKLPEGSLILSTRDTETKRSGIYALDIKAGKASSLLEQDISISGRPTVSDDGRMVLFVAEDSQHGQDIWMIETGSVVPNRVTGLNPRLNNYAMGASALIEWHSLDGELLRGALLLPTNYKKGRRYPLIVWVYGGDTGSDALNSFGPWGALFGVFNTQVLASRGYAILCPDAPMGTSAPVRDLAATVLPGVNKVIELGIADPDRLGIMGQSYGGYSTLAVITETKRFKAAVISAGFGDLVGMYSQFEVDGTAPGVGWAEKGQGRMGGPPWQYPAKYIENSPFYRLDRVETPLLIFHGTADIAPMSLANQVFIGLRRLGKEVEYRQYKGDGHIPQSYRNKVDFLNRLVTWFDQYLKSGASPSN